MARNVLVIMTDQHQRSLTRCYGSESALTPNIDRLSAMGTTFDRAYTNSPICVPARAAFATGRFAHRLRCWDNAAPYTGREAPSWAHRATDAGLRATSIGKLHYRNAQDPTGLSEQILPLHLLNGQGDLFGLLRERMPPRPDSRFHVEDAGEGESEYLKYDRAVANAASKWLHDHATDEVPWVTFVSFATPHFPLRVPRQYLDLFDRDELPLPPAWTPDQWPDHPHVAAIRRLQTLDDPPLDEETVRRAVHCYHALIAFADERVGEVLSALDHTELWDDTVVVYTSDHGEMAGSHGLWWKHCMYERSLAVPLIAVGAGFTPGARCATPVSLVDVYPTVLETLGLNPDPTSGTDGTSLVRIADGADPDRVAFSEYHATYSTGAMYAVMNRRHKLVVHVGHRDQLFDHEADPDELVDLGDDPDHADVRQRLRAQLESIVDPVSTDAAAKRDQSAVIEAAGGVETILARGVEVDFTPAPTV